MDGYNTAETLTCAAQITSQCISVGAYSHPLYVGGEVETHACMYVTEEGQQMLAVHPCASELHQWTLLDRLSKFTTVTVKET